MYAAAAERFGGIDVLYNNAGISPADDALDPRDRGGRLGPRPEREHEGRVPLLQARHPVSAGAGWRLGDQRRLVRRARRSRDVADLVHRVEGRRAVDVAGARVQFARQGVRVNALCPGPVETPLLLRIFGDDPAAYERRRIHLPMGRLAKPREIVNAALFLASDESSYVTGVDVPRRRRPDRRLRHSGIVRTILPSCSPASMRSCAARASLEREDLVDDRLRLAALDELVGALEVLLRPHRRAEDRRAASTRSGVAPPAGSGRSSRRTP